MALLPWQASIQHPRLVWVLQRQQQVGGAMNTHDFLKKQIDQQLQAEGITDRVSFQVAEEALDFYKRTASSSAAPQARVFPGPQARQGSHQPERRQEARLGAS